MSAATYNITIEQGTTYTLPLIISASASPRNLTGYTASAQIRDAYDTDNLIASFGISGSLNSSGTFALTLDSTTTSTLPAPQKCVFDVKLTSGSYSERILQGYASITPAVTQ